jgi:uncharacterized protein YjdB
MRRFMSITAILVVVVMLLLIPVNAAISMQQNGNWGPNPLDPENGNAVVNLASLPGVTITGDDWATGENRGLPCLNDGLTVPISGQSEGWIINYDTVTAKGSEGVNATINFPADSPQKVSTAIIYASFESVGYGMPGKFQIIGTLVDDSQVVLYDQTEYQFVTEPNYHGAYRFNFAPTVLKAVTLKCIEPYTGYTDGKAMPDPNIAYWLSELALFNDVDRTIPVNVVTSDNLAFKATVTTNISNLNKDRPVCDLNNGMGPNPYFGGFLIANGQANLTSDSPFKINFQYPKETTINTIKVYGRDAGSNDGIIGKYRIKAIAKDDAITTIYDSENASAYPNVLVIAAGANQPLSVSFPRTTAVRFVIETWEPTVCGDGGILYWLTEIEMFNQGGAKSITLDKQSLALDLLETKTSTIQATLEPASGQSVIWSSSNADVATVSNGVITAVGTGSCDITVSLADDATVKQIIPVIVVEGIVNVTSVALNKGNITVVVNNADNSLVATVNPSNATIKDVVWSSADVNIATVDENGVVRGVVSGTTTIKASSTADPTKEATCTVVVTKIAVTKVTVAPKILTLDPRAKSTLTAIIEPANATYKDIKWESEDESIAVVDAQTGEVTAVKSGVSCKIYAVSEDDKTIKDFCTLTINSIPVSGIYLYSDAAFENAVEQLEIAQGAKVKIYAYVDPTDATNAKINWSSSDKTIATVDENGLITGVKGGDVTITAASNENTSIKAIIKLKVTSKNAGSSENPNTSDNSNSTGLILAVFASIFAAAFVLGKTKVLTN